MKSNSYNVSSALYARGNNTTHYNQGEIEPRIFIVARWMGQGKKILDVGCYDGSYAKTFALNQNDIYGLDASTDAVSEANKNGVKALVGDLEASFPYEDNYFDIVHAGEVIEHLYDTDVFASECFRVLKPGGFLIVTTPNTVSLPRRILYLFGSGRFLEASNSFSTEEQAVGHIRFFTKSLLKDFLESKGFKIRRFTSDYINFLFFRSEYLAKIFPKFGRTLIMCLSKGIK